MWQCVSTVISSTVGKYTTDEDGTMIFMSVPPPTPAPEQRSDYARATTVSRDLLWQVYLPVGIAAAVACAAAITLGIGSLTGMIDHSVLADALLTMLLMGGIIAGLVSLAILAGLAFLLGISVEFLDNLLEQVQNQSRRAQETTHHYSEWIRQNIGNAHDRLMAMRQRIDRLTRSCQRGVKDTIWRSGDQA